MPSCVMSGLEVTTQNQPPGEGSHSYLIPDKERKTSKLGTLSNHSNDNRQQLRRDTTHTELRLGVLVL